MSDTTTVAKRPNNSVFTKRRVYELLRNTTDEVRSLKSPKAIIEHLEGVARRYVPSGRGRQPGTAVDFAALQTMVDETAIHQGGGDGSFILGMAAARWNCRDGFSGSLMDGTKLRRYVEKGKLRLPENVTLVKRVRKNTSEAVK